ncbi:hypothetical protein [Labilibaculum euxinus]
MIRNQTAKQTDSQSHIAIQELIQLCENNQKHNSDLILCQQHGFIYEGSKGRSFSIGPGDDGLSSFTHLNFISNLANNFITDNENTFNNLDKEQKISLEHSIHLEKMLYLKIWENTYFIKLLTQLVKLACGENYDWNLKIPYQKGTTKSTHIRTNIINRIKNDSPSFYSLLKKSYSQQVRNAIAHSQYYFIQGGIYYANYKSDKYSLLEAMGYKDWENQFSSTMSLFFILNSYLNLIHEKYSQYTISNNNQIEIMVPLENGKFGYMLLEYHQNGKRWTFKQNAT